MAMPFISVPAFPAVPSLPGVPALVRGGTQMFDTLTSNLLGLTDSLDFLTGADAPQWGIFDSTGSPVVVADSVISFGYRNDARISDYPVEQGAFASFNKVANPNDVQIRMTLSGTAIARAEFAASLDAAVASLSLYDVITPEIAYTGMNVIAWDYRREASSGSGMIIADVTIREVRETATAAFSAAAADPTASAPVTAPQTPSAAPTQDQGQVQAATPTPAQDVSTNYVSGSVNDTLGSTLSPKAVQQLQAAQDDPAVNAKMLSDRLNNPPPGMNDEQLQKYTVGITARYGPK
ncbi:MAG: hypothetical protein JWP38_3746 [Herbaspirillum sp.]|nr:hypothetical protein [Herbaspirillum sp.]